jgi:hypothetical protein
MMELKKMENKWSKLTTFIIIVIAFILLINSGENRIREVDAKAASGFEKTCGWSLDKKCKKSATETFGEINAMCALAESKCEQKINNCRDVFFKNCGKWCKNECHLTTSGTGGGCTSSEQPDGSCKAIGSGKYNCECEKV